jgi:hypothetical protein
MRNPHSDITKGHVSSNSKILGVVAYVYSLLRSNPQVQKYEIFILNEKQWYGVSIYMEILPGTRFWPWNPAKTYGLLDKPKNRLNNRNFKITSKCFKLHIFLMEIAPGTRFWPWNPAKTYGLLAKPKNRLYNRNLKIISKCFKSHLF